MLLDEMLYQDVIQRSTSPYGSPSVFVHKKKGMAQLASVSITAN